MKKSLMSASSRSVLDMAAGIATDWDRAYARPPNLSPIRACSRPPVWGEPVVGSPLPLWVAGRTQAALLRGCPVVVIDQIHVAAWMASGWDNDVSSVFIN